MLFEKELDVQRQLCAVGVRFGLGCLMSSSLASSG